MRINNINEREEELLFHFFLLFSFCLSPPLYPDARAFLLGGSSFLVFLSVSLLRSLRDVRRLVPYFLLAFL